MLFICSTKYIGLDLKTDFKPVGVNTVAWAYRDQWNRTQSLKTEPPIYAKLIFTICDISNQCRKDGLFTNWHWEYWFFHTKNYKIRTSPHTMNGKINSR
jgi:hypothetical protein